MTRLLVVVLVLSMTAPAFADIRESAAAQARRKAQEAPAAKRANPYFWPGVGLMGGGALLALYGFNHTTGAEIHIGTDPAGIPTSITAEEKKATGLGFVGLGIAGAGAFVYMKGNKQSAMPSVQFGAGRMALTHRVSF
jgi:hypothetical protein